MLKFSDGIPTNERGAPRAAYSSWPCPRCWPPARRRRSRTPCRAPTGPATRSTAPGSASRRSSRPGGSRAATAAGTARLLGGVGRARRLQRQLQSARADRHRESTAPAPGGPSRAPGTSSSRPPSRGVKMRGQPRGRDVRQRDRAGQRATLVLADQTRHTTVPQDAPVSSIDLSSAEWIVEAPSECVSADYLPAPCRSPTSARRRSRSRRHRRPAGTAARSATAPGTRRRST